MSATTQGAAPPPLTPEQIQELERFKLHERNALLFLKAGGTFSFSEWATFPPQLQAAIARAGERLFYRNAAILGLAAHDPKVALAIYGVFDGGTGARAQEQLAKTQSLSDAVKGMVREATGSVSHGR